MESDTNFSKQFLKELAGDLDTVADYLDDSGKDRKAQLLWRARNVVLSLVYTEIVNLHNDELR